nr:GH25 family lysozyme [Lactiplantibacillus pentosus]
MNFKSQNPIDVSQSQRFKLYKSGKLWLVAGLTFFSFLGGSVVSSTNVHADATPVANAKTTSDSSSAATSTASSAATSAAASDATTKATNASSTTTTQATSAATTKTTDQASAASSGAATSSATSTAASSESSVKTATSASSTATSQATSQATSTATTKASSAATSQATSTAATKASSTATSQATSVASSTATSVASSTAAVKAVAASSTVSSAATTTKKTTAKVAAVAYSAATTSTDVWTIGDTTRPRVDVVDVASYQSAMTQSDYNKLKAAGVKTVIVKSTEGDSYTNPAALNQAKMANKAGLNVDFYHYATFNTSTEAKSEATNMASFLVKNNVSTKVLLFADMEDSSTYTVNAEANLNAFWSTLNSYGYTNHGVYTSNTYLYRDAVIRTVGTSRVWRHNIHTRLLPTICGTLVMGHGSSLTLHYYHLVLTTPVTLMSASTTMV